MRYLGFFPLFFFFLFAGLGGSPINQKIKRHGLSGEYAEARKRMVQEQILGSGIRDERVLRAMSNVPRHLFVSPAYRYLAYADGPLPIGMGQTISQPYIVAFMTEVLELSPDDRVLEVGTGSGYQAAVLAEIVREVYTIELIPDLGEKARSRLEELGYRNITCRIGDGYLGWPDKAPFDAIMVTAAAGEIPQPLIDQLKVGGRLCIPVGGSDFIQYLIRITKTPTGTERETLLPVRFVPLVHPGRKAP